MDRTRFPFPMVGTPLQSGPALPPLPVGGGPGPRRGPQPSMEDLNIVNAMIQSAMARQQPLPTANPVIDPNQAVAGMVSAGAFAPPTTPVNPAFVYDPNPQRTSVNSALNNYFAGIVGHANKAIEDPVGAGKEAVGKIGEASDWGRAHVGRVGAGELLYQMVNGSPFVKNFTQQFLPPGLGDGLTLLFESNPDLQKRVVDAYTNGGAVGVWEDVVAEFGDDLPLPLRVLYHALTDAAIDPVNLLTVLGAGGRGLEAAGKAGALAKGGSEAASGADLARIITGKVIAAPDAIWKHTVDLPFTAVEKGIGKVVDTFGPVRTALGPAEDTVRSEAQARTDDLFDVGARITPDAPSAGTTAPAATAATAEAAPAGGTAAGTTGTAPTVPNPEFAVVRMGPDDYRIIDPATGRPVRTATDDLTFKTHKGAQYDADRRNLPAAPATPTEVVPEPTVTADPGSAPEPITTPTVEAGPIIDRPGSLEPTDAPVPPTGLLRNHWMNPETGRKVPYQNGVRQPSMPEFVTYDLGTIDRPMAEAWWKHVEDDPRTTTFVEEQAAFDRAPSPYGAAPGPLRDSAEKILSQARNEVEVQRQAFRDIVDTTPPEHVFRHGDDLHPAVATRINEGKGGTRYPNFDPAERGDIERNVVERAVFGSDEEASAARQYLQVMSKASTSAAAEKARATRLLEGVRELRASRIAQDGGATLDTADAMLPGMGDAARPTLDRPSNLLDAPPQSTAPTLDLQAQVLDTPEARRQAETLNGQTDMFEGAAPNVVDSAPSAPGATDDLDPSFRRVSANKITTSTGDYQMRQDAFARPTVDHIKATWDPTVGIREPITVSANPDGTYTVLSGHSRLQAVNELIQEGRAPADFRLPVQVREGTAEDLAREALTSNDRTALGPAEEGHKITRLREAGESSETARGTLSRAEAERRVSLTHLSPEMQSLVNQDATLVAKFAPMGRLIEEGVSDSAEMAQYWYKQALPNRLDATSITEELKIIRQMKGPQVQQSGLFAGMDLGSSAASDAFAKVRTLRKQRALLNTERRNFTGVKNSSRVSAKVKTEAEKVLADLQQEVAALESDLGIAPKASRKPRGASGIVSEGTLNFWDLQDRVGGAIGDAARRAIPDLPGEIADVADETSLGRAFSSGEIDRESYDGLNRVINVGGRPIRLYDLVQEKLTQFGGNRQDAINSLRADVARADGMTAPERGRLLRAVGGFEASAREKIMYNPTNMVRGAIADQAGDMLAMAVTGSADAAVSSLNLKNAYRWWKYGRNAETAILDDPRVLGLEGYGSSVPRDLLNDVSRGDTKMFGEMKVTAAARTIEQKIAGENAPRVISRLTPALASKTARDIRTALDRNRRLSQYWSTFQKQMPEARATLEGFARTHAGDDVGNLIAQMPDQFTPEDVVRVTGNDQLSRQWRSLVSKAEKAANAEVNKVLFSYKMTTLDSKLKHVVFFHYWMSRSLLLHTRAALSNPAILGAYVKGFEQLEQMSEAEGLPDNVRTYFKFMGNVGGWYSLADPIGALLPYSIFRDMGTDEAHGTTFDKVVAHSGLFLNPLVQAAATAFGLSENVADPFSTHAVRSYAKTVLDFARNNGLDLGAMGPGITVDPMEGLIRRFYETTSDLADTSGLVPFAKKLPFFDSTANEQTQVLDVLKTQMEGEYGPFTTWDDAQRDEFLQAQIAIQLQKEDNERANGALADWSAGKATGKAVGLVTPGGVWTKYGPRDERMRLRDEGNANRDAGVPLTPEQQNAADATQQINAADPTAAEARTDQDAYGKIGGDRGQEITQNWNLLAFGSLKELWNRYPGGAVTLRDGRLVPFTAFVRMSKDERTDAADFYLETNNLKPEYDAVRTEQGTFKDENPVYKGYSDFGKMGRDYPGGIAQFRTDLMAANPAYRTYIGRLRPDVKNNEESYDQASISMDAYLATKGTKSNVYSPELPPPGEEWASTQFLLNALGGSKASTKKKYDLDTPEGQLASLRDKLATYDRDMAVYDQAVAKESNGIPYDQLAPYMQTVVRRTLDQKGIKKPGEPGVLSSYNLWRMAQPDPSTATPEQYVTWLTEFERAQEKPAA